MADPRGRWRSFPGETPDTVLGSTRASGNGVRRAVSRQALDESVRKKAYRSVRCSHTLAARGRMAVLQRQCGGRGFGSIHGSYVEPGEPIDTVGAPEDLQAGAEQVIAACREASLIDTLYSGPAMAASLPLSPIRAVTKAKGGKLYIERTMLRERIAATKGSQGITGEPSCGLFGVCGSGRMTIAHHTNTTITDPAKVPVVCRFAPRARDSG